MIVSPTYFGAVADVAALAEVAHGRGLPLIADEAWGAHLHFSSALPTAALECGADVVLSSTHKIAGSITQSAVLHIGECEDRIDERILDRAVTLVESTSPNALLTASLDATRRQAAVHGEELLAETVESLAELRQRIRELPGLDVLDDRIVGRAGRARLRPDPAGGRRPRPRRHRPPGRADHARAGRHQPRAVLRERDRRRVRDRRARRPHGRAPGGGARARERADRRGGLRAAAAVRRAAAVGADRALAARGVPRRPGGGRRSTRPRAGSRPSRWPPTRPGSRTCSRASG